MKVLITGSAGFMGGYLVQELLTAGHEVIGIDNLSKYGATARSFDGHPRYTFVNGDCKDTELLKEHVRGCDQLVAMAAMIGGISYFHKFAYDLLAENERILAATFDAAIWAFKSSALKRIVVASSSMVFESTTWYPSSEGDQLKCPPPQSTYGFQKLSCEYFARGAHEQYGLPYTIIRPFNCVGIGEKRALQDEEVKRGNIELAMSHVVPDLVQKVLRGQDPLEILGSGDQIRHYTYGGDLARGIRLALESDAAVNEDFNLSTAESTTVLDLARLIWQKIHGDNKPFSYVSVEPFMYDVQKRVPDVSKARRLLGFEATTSIHEMLDEVIPWIERQIQAGAI
jgi:UDP-glucose 4-epimerase